MMFRIDVAEQDRARPEAAMSAQRNVPRERGFEVDTGGRDRGRNLPVNETGAVVGCQQAGVARRRLIEVAAVAGTDRKASLPAPAAPQRSQIGIDRADHPPSL